ncbi:MAG: hypothetical protein J6A54_00185 [Clostridia bacterium]|nr:hypothetical protein [Clostridia bacterium]
MKKVIKACTLLIVLAMALSLCTLTIFAGEGSGCDATERNVALEATATSSSNCWVNKDHVGNLIDGDKTTGVGTSHSEGSVTMTVTYPQSYKFSKIVFTFISTGRVSEDGNLSNQNSGMGKDFPFTVKMFEKTATGDVNVFTQSYNTESKREVVIDTSAVSSAVYKIEISQACQWNNGNIFWEMETFTKDNHNWQIGTPTKAPTCTETGIAPLTCECGETKTSIIPATGHTNTDPCATTCTTCSQAKEPEHVFANACDTTCEAAGCTGTRVAPHRAPDDAPCALVCADCGEAKASTAKHTFATVFCATACTKCGAEELRVPLHSWSGDHNTDPCLTTCTYCNVEQKPHKYSSDCDSSCDIANCTGSRESLVAHTYGPVYNKDNVLIDATLVECDESCNACGEGRVAPHKYSYACDAICDLCNQTTKDAKTLHVWAHDCATQCSNEGCGMTRKINHKYTSDCDAVCDTEGCGFERTPPVVNHQWTNDCDTVCDVEKCGFTRTPNPHKYDNDCDVDCNVCKTAREVAGHGYDNDCDTDCNTCGITREVGAHKYDNACDGDCNSCGATRTTQHSFSVWMTTTEPTKKEDGVSTRYCTVCNFDETQAIPAEGGMPTGAIVAIVLGSVAVLGGGGFCLYWFVLRKKFFS